MKRLLGLVSLILCLCMALPLIPAMAEEPVTITFVRPGNKPDNYDAQIANVNAKLAEDGMNMKLEINYIASDVFQDKLTMMTATGDAFDLVAVMEDQKSFTAYVAMESLLPLNDYLEGMDALSAVIPETIWNSAKIDGKIYTIPAFWTDLADQASCITIDRANLKRYGVDVPQTREDLLALCDAYAAGWEGDSTPYVIPMYKEPFTWLFRTLDSYPFTVVDELLYVTQEGEVKNWIATEEFKTCADFFATLYDKGYVSPDILSTSWSSWNQLISGNFMWCDGCQMWGSEDYFKSLIPGCELDSVYLAPEAASFRPAAFRNSIAVSATSEHPQDAVRFVNWMYASQDNYDAMVYGIEGVDWTNEGERQYTKLNPGVDNFNDDWMVGNLTLLRTEVGTYPTFIEIMYTEKKEAEDSVVINFTFDPSNVSTEYANCMALVTSDIYPIKLGIVKYADGGDAVLQQLEAAGLDKVIAEYQRQLDAFLGK
ncbi:MAG: extracellular solute-binding protein [Candidatus Limiplasma sp.]|nr:extracellular solute-binding protein [Candidatus Limiplasma sp.]